MSRRFESATFRKMKGELCRGIATTYGKEVIDNLVQYKISTSKRDRRGETTIRDPQPNDVRVVLPTDMTHLRPDGLPRYSNILNNRREHSQTRFEMNFFSRETARRKTPIDGRESMLPGWRGQVGVKMVAIISQHT